MIAKKSVILGAVLLLACVACKKTVDGEASASASADTKGKADAETSANAHSTREGDAQSAGSKRSTRSSSLSATVQEPITVPRLNAWISGSGLTTVDSSSDVRVPVNRGGGQEFYAYPPASDYQVESDGAFSVASRNGRRVVLFSPPNGAKVGDKFPAKIGASYPNQPYAEWSVTVVLTEASN